MSNPLRDPLPYMICDQDSGEELGMADTLEGARLGAEVLSHEQRINVVVVPREEA